jgi:hypothetical protein
MADHKNKFYVYEQDEEWRLPNGAETTNKSGWRWLCAEYDGLAGWNAEVLLEAWKRTENRGNAHGWIDRLCGHL